MEIVNFTKLRQHLATVMDTVVASRAPVIVSRRGAEPVVMMPLEEYNAIEETLHLQRSPVNANRLAEAIAAAEAGHVTERDLIDPDE